MTIDQENSRSARTHMLIRVKIAGPAGTTPVELTEDDIVSCELDLRADLRRIDPTVPISTIKLQYTDGSDLSDFLFGIRGWTITYSAGYDGDMSETRTFYVKEATQDGILVSITGEDTVGRLDDVDYGCDQIRYPWLDGECELWDYVKNILSDAGITPVHADADPTRRDNTASTHYMVIKSSSARQRIADINNLSAWRFVDAGIPTITRTIPSVDDYWTIREEDCADLHREVRTSIRSISCDDDHGVQNSFSGTGSAGGGKLVAGEQTTADRFTSIDTYDYYHRYYGSYTAYQGHQSGMAIIIDTPITDFVETRPDHVTVKSVADTDTQNNTNFLYISGNAFQITAVEKSITDPDGADDITIEPLTAGQISSDSYSTHPTYPRYRRLLGVQKAGSFTWRGDPRMQPMDAFRLQKRDGSYVDCMIESILLTHNGGGLTASITYVEGVS